MKLFPSDPAEIQYSPLMQTIPAATITESQNAERPPIFYKPYNHYTNMPISLGIESDKPRVSAFKPVAKRQEQMHEFEPNYYNLLPLLNVSPNSNNNENYYGYGQSQIPVPIDPFGNGHLHISPSAEQTPNIMFTNAFYEELRRTNDSVLMARQNECTSNQLAAKPTESQFQQYHYGNFEFGLQE